MPSLSFSLSSLLSLFLSLPLSFFLSLSCYAVLLLSLLPLFFSFASFLLSLLSAIFFWIDGCRRPCFFSRPETPTHPLVACESAIRWDGGNGISLLTRDCCRRRPPCFLLLLRFLLLFLLAPPHTSPSLVSSRVLYSPSLRPTRWNSPKFFAPTNKHHCMMEGKRPSPKVDQLSLP